MNKWLELLVGLILVLGSILLAGFILPTDGTAWDFWHAAWDVLKGGVFWAVVGIGALFVLLGISDLKN